jgi:hypothetical protein
MSATAHRGTQHNAASCSQEHRHEAITFFIVAATAAIISPSLKMSNT